MHPVTLLFIPALAALPAPLDGVADFFKKGGLFMIPLVLCSLGAVAIAILRAIALRRDAVLPRVLVAELERMPSGGNAEHLTRLTEGDPSALAALTRTGLRHRDWPKAENVEAVQTAARREVMRLETGLGTLELIVGIAPLLGLLGAVSGLVHLFSNFGTTKGGMDNAFVARGIAEALNTTIFGLAIAIPALIASTYFNRKVEAMSVEMESLLAELLTKCYIRRGPGSGAAAPSVGRVASAPASAFEDPVLAETSSGSGATPMMAAAGTSALRPARIEPA